MDWIGAGDILFSYMRIKQWDLLNITYILSLLSATMMPSVNIFTERLY